MAATNIEPLEEAYRKMREMTKPNKPVVDERGPLVYELTREFSTNGVDLKCKDKEGGCVHEP